MKVRRWIALLAVLVGSAIALPTTTAGAAVGGNEGFLEIRNNGELWYYEWDGVRRFNGYPAGTGWGQTKLIATVSANRFV